MVKQACSRRGNHAICIAGVTPYTIVVHRQPRRHMLYETSLVITVTKLHVVISNPYPLVDPGGAAGTCPPPTGSISFIFTHVFAKKCMCQRSAPPPQWEILDPPLVSSQKKFRCSLCICHATGMEEGPKVTLDIQCLWRGGGAALTSTNNYFLYRRGSGGARAITV